MFHKGLARRKRNILNVYCSLALISFRFLVFERGFTGKIHKSISSEGRDNEGRDGDTISNEGRDVSPVSPLKGETRKLWDTNPARARRFSAQHNIKINYFQYTFVLDQDWFSATVI